MGAKTTNPNKVPHNAVLLSKVSTLTLYGGKQTSSRRVSPVPQLLCVGPPDVCALYVIDVMRCTNEGADYDAENVQWACRASLPEEFKLGSTEVACEGYESSDDSYVLKGSCGVEYRLLLTDKGETRYRPKQHQQQQPVAWNHPQVQAAPEYTVGSSSSSWDRGEKIAGTVFFLIFFAVLLIILFGLISAWLANDDTTQLRPLRITGNGGGGGPGNDDPPPPYDSPPQPKKKSPPRRSSERPPSSSNRNQTQDGWRPGVWTGAAAGAAAGYMAGRASRSTQTRSPPPPPQMQQQPTYQYDYPQYQAPQPAPPPRPANPIWPFGGRSNNPPAAVASSSSASSPSYSSERHESTGFGTTRRR